MSSLSNTDYAKTNWNPHLLFLYFHPISGTEENTLHFPFSGSWIWIYLISVMIMADSRYWILLGWCSHGHCQIVEEPGGCCYGEKSGSGHRQWKHQTQISRAHQSFPSLSLHLTLLVAEAISLCPQTTSLPMGYCHLPTLPRSSETTLANTATGTTSPETVREWRWRGYLLDAVDTVLYPQRNAPMQHCSVPSLGTVLQSLTAVGLYLHLPK